MSGTENIAWNQGNLHFEVECPIAPVAARLRQVLSYWKAPALPGSSSVPLSRQSVVPHSDGYLHRAPTPEMDNRVYGDVAPLVRAVETTAGMAVLNHYEQFTSVHGALLARGSDGVLLVGPSQSGKSTTSCALWAAGWQLLADDVTLLHAASATATPLMRRVSLRHPSRDLLGEDFWKRMLAATTCDPTSEGYVFHPDELEGQSRARIATLRAIVFLRRLNAPEPGPAQVAPVTQVQSLMSLAPYTNTVRHTSLGDTMQRLGPLVNAVPTYDMGRGPLPEMIAALETLLPAVPA